MGERLPLEQPWGASSHRMHLLEHGCWRVLLCDTDPTAGQTGPGLSLHQRQGQEARLTVPYGNRVIKNECQGHAQGPSPLHTKALQLFFGDIFSYGYQTGLDLMSADGSCADVAGPSSQTAAQARPILTAKDGVLPGKSHNRVSLKPN